VGQNAAFDDLVSDFAPGPVADGTLGVTGRFAGQGHNLAHLLRRDLDRPAGARPIGEPLGQAQVLRDPLQTQSARAPVARLVQANP